MTVDNVVHMTTAMARWLRKTYCGQPRLFADTLAWGEVPVLLETSDVSQVTCSECIDSLAASVEGAVMGETAMKADR